MPSNYRELTIQPMPIGSTICRPSQRLGKISLEDNAVEVMTNLHKVSAVTVNASAGIDEAERKMKSRQVRLLFVTDHQERIIGITTLSDIYGERPMQMQQQNNMPRAELCVIDIMTGIESLDVLSMQEVLSAKVGDIVSTLKKLQRQHALVMQETEGSKKICGIFSTTQLSHQLEIDLSEHGIAHNLAELESLRNSA